MKKKLFKKSTALLLSILLVLCSLPFVSFAAEGDGITIKSNVSAQEGTEIDADIEFEYYIEINHEPFNGTATGDNRETYTITNGILKMPYGVSAVLDNVANGSYYSVKRLAYDNSKYALIAETEAQEGELSGMEYYVSYGGGEAQLITEEEYNTATDNGNNTTITVYRDDTGKVYDKEEITTDTAYDAIRTQPVIGSATYSIEEKSYSYVTASLEKYQFDYTVVNTGYSAPSGTFGSYTYNGTDSITVTGFSLDEGVETTDTFSGTSSRIGGSQARAAESFISTATSNIIRLSYRVLTENIKEATGKTAVLATNVTTLLPVSTDLTESEQTFEFGTEAYAFTEVTQQEAVYTTKEVSAAKELVFDAVFAPAPTGSFAVDFMIYDGSLPLSFDGATFEIRDALGTPLSDGNGYTFEYDETSITVPILNYTLGFSHYKYSGLKAGSYTIQQTGSQEGYIVDTTVYSFVVERDGTVTGDNFGSSSFGSYTALTNNNYSLITNYKVFKNNSISINFNKVDQNGEPVEGADFLLIERNALIQFVWDLGSAGIEGVGGMDLGAIIEELGSADWSNLDVGTIIGLILQVVNVANFDPSLLEGIRIPAILTSTSDADGKVELNNSKNVLNILGTLANSGISGDQLKTVLEAAFGSVIPEEYLPLLEGLTGLVGVINVTTGFKDGSYIMIETSAPYGYERNSTILTFVLNKDGTASVSTGVLFPVIVDAINSQFGIDLNDFIISEEQFNQLADTIGSAFATFDECADYVIGNVVDFLAGVLGEDNATAQFLDNVKNTIHDYYEQYDDLAQAIAEGVKAINDYMSDSIDDDFSYLDTRYFVDITVNVSDCLGNPIDGATYGVYDSANAQVEWSVENSVVNVPFGDYTLKAEIPEGWEAIDPDAATTVTVDDANGEYAFNLVYHYPAEPYNDNEVEATRGEDGGYDIVTKCNVCGEELSREHVTIPALGVDITVFGSDLGTMTLNGEIISDGISFETRNIPYVSSYTLVATPDVDCLFVGWYSNGKLLTANSTYTTYAYADTTYVPVFHELNHEENIFQVTFVDMFGNVITILDNEAIAALEAMPTPPQHAGMKFTGWSMTLEEVKALTDSAIVYARYTSDKETVFTITADGCDITVDGETFTDTATASYNSRITVAPTDGEATAWFVNGTVAAYTDAYSFLCGSDITITYQTASEASVPLVVSVNKARIDDSHRINFLATRFVPEGYELVESGFVYGKGMDETDLRLTNVGTTQGTDDGTVKTIKNSNTAAEGQFALSYGVTAMDTNACARPYMIYVDSDGATTLIYGDAMIFEYE